MTFRELAVLPEGAGQRADVFLAAVLPEMSRSGIQKLLEDGYVTCGGAALRKSTRLTAGQALTVTLPDPTPDQALPQELPLDVVYEDSDLIVINKPRGLVVHPAAGNPDGTLVNALLHHCGGELSGINGVLRPGIVHRLDRDTSGLLVAAKNDTAHRHLAAQLAQRHMSRVYEAVVRGAPPESGRIDAPIARHPTDRKRMAVAREGGRDAVTHYRTLAIYPGWAHVECRLETGRTHQIRVHMAHIGHPVAGDPVYNRDKDPFRLGGQCLHAKTLGFVHPRNGNFMEFCAELPEYFTRVLTILSLTV